MDNNEINLHFDTYKINKPINKLNIKLIFILFFLCKIL